MPLRKGDIVGALQLALHQGGKTLPLEQGKQIAVRAAMNGASSVDISKAPLVFLGYGVKAPERNWDDFKGVDLKGKIAVVLINDPDFETGQGDFDGKGMTYYGRWTQVRGRRPPGALGVLIVHETAPASYGWATVAGSNTNTMFDVVRDNPAESHPLLEGWIQRDLAVELFRSAGQDFEALKKAQQRDFPGGADRRQPGREVRGEDRSDLTTWPRAWKAAAIRTRPSSTARTGTTSAWASRTRAVTASSTARWTTPAAPPRWSSWPVASPRRSARSARCCSWRSPPRKRPAGF